MLTVHSTQLTLCQNKRDTITVIFWGNPLPQTSQMNISLPLFAATRTVASPLQTLIIFVFRRVCTGLAVHRVTSFHLWQHLPRCWYVLSPKRKRTISEACLGRARFQQHRDASCHQVFSPCKARRRRKFTPFWQKHYLVYLQAKAPKEIHAILT